MLIVRCVACVYGLLLCAQAYGDNWRGIFEAITGYGLGGSSIALFGRVGGGIYTKVRATNSQQQLLTFPSSRVPACQACE